MPKARELLPWSQTLAVTARWLTIPIPSSLTAILRLHFPIPSRRNTLNQNASSHPRQFPLQSLSFTLEHHHFPPLRRTERFGIERRCR